MNTLLIIVILFIILSIIITYSLFYNKKQLDNFKGNVETSFLYKKPSENELKDSLYSSIIKRPIDKSVRLYKGQCTNPLYPHKTSKFGKGEMTVPCNSKNKAKYHASRPILNSDSYHDMIEYLFENIKDNVILNNESSLIFPEEFSSSNEYSDVIKFIMKKINYGKDNLEVFKNYAKNDTWKGEQFAFLNQKVFIYQSHDLSKLDKQQKAFLAKNGGLEGNKKFIVSFTLYNTRRSISTDVIATLFLIEKQFKLKSIVFSSKKETHDFVSGQNIPGKTGIQLNNSLSNQDNSPQWVYGNTLENETFNKKGFHDPDSSKNFIIKGGVPDGLMGVLKQCENGYLLECGSPNRLKGGNDTYNTVYPDINNKTEKWSYKT